MISFSVLMRLRFRCSRVIPLFYMYSFYFYYFLKTPVLAAAPDIIFYRQYFTLQTPHYRLFCLLFFSISYVFLILILNTTTPLFPVISMSFTFYVLGHSIYIYSPSMHSPFVFNGLSFPHFSVLFFIIFIYPYLSSLQLQTIPHIPFKFIGNTHFFYIIDTLSI